jgi:hypothetical protein
MPHWVALVAIVAVAWLMLAVVGGWLIGRGLRAIERRTDAGELAEPGPTERHDLRRAA